MLACALFVGPKLRGRQQGVHEHALGHEKSPKMGPFSLRLGCERGIEVRILSRSSYAQAYGLIPVEGATSPGARPAYHRLKRYEPQAVDVLGLACKAGRDLG